MCGLALKLKLKKMKSLCNLGTIFDNILIRWSPLISRQKLRVGI